MSKLILTTAAATAMLSLAACGRDEYNEANAAYNAEETNYAEENMADYNDMNMATENMGNAMDNGADNATDNATGNATGNEAIDNRTY